jgi:hypothetical protein
MTPRVIPAHAHCGDPRYTNTYLPIFTIAATACFHRSESSAPVPTTNSLPTAHAMPVPPLVLRTPILPWTVCVAYLPLSFQFLPPRPCSARCPPG